MTARRFEFTYRTVVPKRHQSTRLWVPMPAQDAFQDVLQSSVDVSVASMAKRSFVDGNEILYVELPPYSEPSLVSISFVVHRKRRSSRVLMNPKAHVPDREAERCLAPDSRVPTDGDFARQAQELIGLGESPRTKSRAVFEHLLDAYAYDCTGCTPEKGDSVGDLPRACSLKLGTCTDLHGLLVAYLRALGVPARFAFGFNVPTSGSGDIAGYHCWAEVFLPDNGWFPIDVSEALKRSTDAEREFYFGGLDENRVQFSMGRDLVLDPPQESGPVDRFIFPLCESGRARMEIFPQFSYRALND